MLKKHNRSRGQKCFFDSKIEFLFVTDPRFQVFFVYFTYQRILERRLKRMAFGWSEEGAAKMAKIIIKCFTSAGQWDEYWKKKLRIKGNIDACVKSIDSQKAS